VLGITCSVVVAGTDTLLLLVACETIPIKAIPVDSSICFKLVPFAARFKPPVITLTTERSQVGKDFVHIIIFLSIS
jgi:hypothetical protein